MMNIWPRPFSAAQFSSQVHVCSEDDEDPGAGEKILGSGPQDPWGSHEFCWKTHHGGPWNHSETIPLRRPRLLERMGLENLLLVVSHWNSGANMGKLRHPSLVHFSFQCLNSFLENMRWNRICSEAILRCSKIIWFSQLGSPLAGFRIVIGFKHTQHAMARGGVNRLGTELFKRGTSKELKRKSQFLGPPQPHLWIIFMAI